jgi:hypothetical protein
MTGAEKREKMALTEAVRAARGGGVQRRGGCRAAGASVPAPHTPASCHAARTPRRLCPDTRSLSSSAAPAATPHLQAISSALSHPNVVQTFTYDIKPLRDTSGRGPSAGAKADGSTAAEDGGASGSGVHSLEVGRLGGVEVGGIGGVQAPRSSVRRQAGPRPRPQAWFFSARPAASAPPLTRLPPSPSHPPPPPAQVRLVLEYCDRGSVRDALDHGAFLLPQPAGAAGHPARARRGGPPRSAVNYAAVLDTAIDVAGAMCHLHGHSVIHGDLKVRPGCGAAARGHGAGRLHGSKGLAPRQPRGCPAPCPKPPHPTPPHPTPPHPPHPTPPHRTPPHPTPPHPTPPHPHPTPTPHSTPNTPPPRRATSC